MGCGVGDPPNAKTIIKKKKKMIYCIYERERGGRDRGKKWKSIKYVVAACKRVREGMLNVEEIR